MLTQPAPACGAHAKAVTDVVINPNALLTICTLPDSPKRGPLLLSTDACAAWVKYASESGLQQAKKGKVFNHLPSGDMVGDCPWGRAC